jgi:pyruvate dehydrogenase E1 component alpha subunit
VNGSDALAVWQAFAPFLARAREGRGPMLLECLTHRRRGHYEGDPEQYRDPVAEEQWRTRDPVARLEQRAIAAGWLTEAAAREIETAARAAIEAAVRFARDSPYPEPELAGRLVYAAGDRG